MRPGSRHCFLLLACAALLAVAAGSGLACSKKPRKDAQGRTILMSAEDEPVGKAEARRRREVLLTKADDKRLGREASEQVASQMGVIEDDGLTPYVQEIGAKLLRGIPRRSFQYHFFVVDQVEPNAFALPGGYIFISRGLLALANSEDELACVIGHEITHSHRRHAAAQQAASRHMSALSMPWIRAANMAAYGRDMEREADEGGQKLAAAAGYDPMGMSTFLASLKQNERLLRGYARVPSFYDTHPGAAERASVNAVRAKELRWKRDPALGDTHASYLHHVDGITLGPRPEGGIFEGQRFIHPLLGFQMRFPDGWRTQNTNAAVGATSRRGDAVVFLSGDPSQAEPREAAATFLTEESGEIPYTVVGEGPVKLGGIEAWRLVVRAPGRGGSLTAQLHFFRYRDLTWRITAVTETSSEKRFHGRLLSTVRSFRPLTPAQIGAIETERLRIAEAKPSEDLVGLCDRSACAWNATQIGVFNSLPANHRFGGGELVKIARTEVWKPEAEPPERSGAAGATGGP